MFYACFTLIEIWESRKYFEVGIFLIIKLVKVGLQETNNSFLGLMILCNIDSLYSQGGPFMFSQAGLFCGSIVDISYMIYERICHPSHMRTASCKTGSHWISIHYCVSDSRVLVRI